MVIPRAPECALASFLAFLVVQFSIRNMRLLLQLCLLAACTQPNRACGQEPTWTDTRQLGPFICQATFPLADHERLLGELPELQRELTRTLGVPPTRQPINIYLFSDAEQHQAYLSRHFPSVPYRRALFVKSEATQAVYAFRQPELDVDLRHECTHALLNSVLKDLPLWLDEGLAEYFEMPPGQRAFDHPHSESLRWNMRLGIVRSIESLEVRQELSDMGTLDYRYSWAWVHFMLHGPEPAHHALVGYLAESRKDSAATFSARMAAAMPNASERLVQHFKHWHP
jgi:hypothetical protein